MGEQQKYQAATKIASTGCSLGTAPTLSSGLPRSVAMID